MQFVDWSQLNWWLFFGFFVVVGIGVQSLREKCSEFGSVARLRSPNLAQNPVEGKDSNKC